MISTLSKIGDQYNPKKKRIAQYIEKATKLELNSIDTKSNSHEKCNIIRDTIFKGKMKNAALLQSIISLKDIMPNKSYSKVERPLIKNISCGCYTKNASSGYGYSYEYLYSNIQYLISEKKIINLMIGLEEYCLIEGEKENYYTTHSICLLLIPSNGEYNAYYINSHGRDMADTCNYVRKITKKRTKTVTFKIPSELVLIRDMIDYWNSLNDFNDEPIKINWDAGRKHTYYSTNLQEGDYHGVCFAFPQVLWNHMGEFYSKKKTLCSSWGTINIASGKSLLESGHLDIFVKYSFTNFNKKYHETFIKTIGNVYLKSSNDPLQIIIGIQRTALIKCILCSLVRYMEQV